MTDTSPVPGCAPEPVVIAADLTPELLALLTAEDGEPAYEVEAEEPPAAEEVAAESVDEAVAQEPASDSVDEPVAQQPAAAESVDEQPVTSLPRRRAVRRQGVAELVDLGPVDPGLLAQLLTDPAGLPVGLGRVHVRRTCVDRTGQVVAVDDRTLPLARLLTPPADERAGPRSRSADLLTRLLADLPAPPPMTDAHDPTAAQTRVVRARDVHCTFPGCGRRARRSDLDHRVPHPEGATSVTNLHPLCGHHHRLKHDGWTCRRDAAGATHWTSPRGQQVTVRRC